MNLKQHLIEEFGEEEQQDSTIRIFVFISDDFVNNLIVKKTLKLFNYRKVVYEFYQNNNVLINTLDEICATTNYLDEKKKFDVLRKANFLCCFYCDDDETFPIIAKTAYQKNKPIILVPQENQGYYNELIKD